MSRQAKTTAPPAFPWSLPTISAASGTSGAGLYGNQKRIQPPDAGWRTSLPRPSKGRRPAGSCSSLCPHRQLYRLCRFGKGGQRPASLSLIREDNSTLDPREYALFREELSDARSLVYLTDNCGEIVLDKIAVKMLQKLYPHLSITVIVAANRS